MPLFCRCARRLRSFFLPQPGGEGPQARGQAFDKPHLELVVQQGTGKKNDPYRYALPGKEEEWKKSPFYELNKKFEESRRLVQETLGEPLWTG